MPAGLIVTEPIPRDPELAACTTQGELRVRIVLSADGGHTVLIGELADPELFPEFADGFPQIIWPFGFSAEPGPSAVILDDAGDVVATENEVVRLMGGSIGDDGYHVCMVDGVEYLGGSG